MTEQMAGSAEAGGESILDPGPLDVPTEARQHFERAGAYEARYDFANALRACDLTIELAPTWAEAHNLRGVVLDAMGRKEAAIAAYREALRLDPAFGEAQENLSEAEAEFKQEKSPGKPIESKRAVYRPGCVVAAVLWIAFIAVVGGIWDGVRWIGEVGPPAYGQVALGVLMLVSAAGIWAMKKWAAFIFVGFAALVFFGVLVAILPGVIAGEGFVIYDRTQFTVTVVLYSSFVAIALGLVNLWRKGELS